MQSMTHVARRRGHLSRLSERQGLVRAAALSRRTPAMAPGAVTVKLEQGELELIDRLVRGDRTAVSSALLAIAGIGAGEASRRAVLTQVGEAARGAQAEGAITAERGEQIARHVTRALERTAPGVTA